ncbi:MAG: hypothetical protein JSV23_01115 [Promethearchaeota archaeon]|nr:MAG: hypothetical protein JSV23_01115 [Candidatus Lokiarchaeota archaeon]
MAKKKKKSQKKKKAQDVEEGAETMSDYSLDQALHSAKTTETTLQTLLEGVSEGQGFVHLKREGDVKITPQLSHESKSKIAEAYILEDVPLTKRTKEKKKPRTSLVPEVKEDIKPEVTTPPYIVEKPLEQVEKLPPPTLAKEEPSLIKKGSIYLKLTEFFEDLLKSYNENYDRWEMSISNILAILRKMRKITKKNTDDLVVSINNVFEKIQDNLEQFKIKRKEIEKVAEVDIEGMSEEFRKVLGLLELQVKEYQLKRITDEFIHE